MKLHTGEIAFNALDQQHDSAQCQEDKCKSAAIACTIEFQDEKTQEWKTQTEYFCPEHATEHGFCCCCGTFIAGIDDLKSMCEICEVEVRTNFGEYDEEEDDMDDFFEDDNYL